MYQLSMGTDIGAAKMVSGIFWFVYLAILSIQDIRSRTVSAELLAAGVAAALIYQIVWGENDLKTFILGSLLGAMFLGISRITGEALGYGDSILMLAMGMYLGIWNFMYLLVTAFTLSSIFSMVVLIEFRYYRKKTFPFIPFLAAGYLVVFLTEIL